ncbi:hypothetical protein LINGRAHAP2_LOCUS10886 [Linum grandiflorum]
MLSPLSIRELHEEGLEGARSGFISRNKTSFSLIQDDDAAYTEYQS